mmetsp:Transcript_20241/g.22915  ORF Transcript_20241/g.22915 Transcript_20241/m.22915 type:complete len:400 (-) Transcript_20241:464-1663(-)
MDAQNLLRRSQRPKSLRKGSRLSDDENESGRLNSVPTIDAHGKKNPKIDLTADEIALFAKLKQLNQPMTTARAIAPKKRKSTEEKVRYCLCKSRNAEGPMVCCDHCNEWFHFACLNLEPSLFDYSKAFKCPKCVLYSEKRKKTTPTINKKKLPAPSKKAVLKLNKVVATATKISSKQPTGTTPVTPLSSASSSTSSNPQLTRRPSYPNKKYKKNTCELDLLLQVIEEDQRVMALQQQYRVQQKMNMDKFHQSLMTISTPRSSCSLLPSTSISNDSSSDHGSDSSLTTPGYAIVNSQGVCEYRVNVTTPTSILRVDKTVDKINFHLDPNVSSIETVSLNNTKRSLVDVSTCANMNKIRGIVGRVLPFASARNNKDVLHNLKALFGSQSRRHSNSIVQSTS